MIRKRKSRNEVSSDCENLEEQQSNRKNISENLSEQNKMVDVSKFSSPTFNIHIHVPPYNMSSSKIYLPRIQPVIHLHFDEIARKFEVNQKEKVQESWGKAIETLLPVASPRFGDVKFHFNNKSRGRYLKRGNETPRSTRTACNDCQLSRGKRNEKIQSRTSKRSRVVCELSDNKSTIKEDFKNISDEMLLSKYKDLNLKKAVVLLTDICKSKNWPNIVTPGTAATNSDKSQNENSSPENKMENKDEDVDHERFPIKQENISLTPIFNARYEFDNTLESDCGKFKVEEIKVSTSTVQDMISNNKSLTALVEGCNFSEILKRCRAKFKHCTSSTVISQENCNSRVSEDCFSKATTSYRNLEASDSHSKINNTELESDKNVPDENLSPSLLKDDSFNVEKENFLRESDEETVDFEYPGIRNYEVITKSDKVSFTSEKHSSTDDVIMDSETLEFSSSYKINSDCEGNFKVSEMQSSHLFDVGNVDFHLKLIKKEMKRRNQMSSEISKNIISNARKKSSDSSAECNESSASKKMKPSDKKSQEKSSKSSKPSSLSSSSSSSPPPPASSSTEDYIPVNASGSTRFAVAPLDMISPYKTHSAKNFKQDMLFGSRVARFSSSEKLRYYQMKQATRRSFNK